MPARFFESGNQRSPLMCTPPGCQRRGIEPQFRVVRDSAILLLVANRSSAGMNLVFYDRVSIQLIEAEGGKRNWRFRTNSAPYQSGSLGRTRFCILARTSKTGRCGRTTVDE